MPVLDEVGEDYGDEVRFFERLSPEDALALFLGFAAENGVPSKLLRQRYRTVRTCGRTKGSLKFSGSFSKLIRYPLLGIKATPGLPLPEGQMY
jgi:hypothetical protein